MNLRIVCILLVAVLAAAVASVAQAQCEPHWARGLFPTNDHPVMPYALCVYDDGSGPALYAGGDFEDAGDVGADGIARWRNGRWEKVAGGVNGHVYCLCVYDDGSGPALYAGGIFATAGDVSAQCIARYRNGTWEALGSGVGRVSSAPLVYCLCVFDDGTGPALYVGGEFTTAGGLNTYYVARWRSGTWQAVGGGMDDRVESLCVYDDGTGSALYAGGWFWRAGHTWAAFAARWRNGKWEPIGFEYLRYLKSLCVFDDGTGPALYAGGESRYVRRWSHGIWQTVGEEFDGYWNIYALCAYDDGAGSALYAAGDFTTVGGIPAESIARWTNGAWEPVGSGITGRALSLCVHDDGGGSALFAGGQISSVGGFSARGIAKCANGTWESLGAEMGGVLSPTVRSICFYDDGTGQALYVGGYFTTAGGIRASCVAKCRNGTWEPLGSGMGLPYGQMVNAVCGHDDGSGPAVYVGGTFASAGGLDAEYVARWRNGAWEALGNGVDSPVNCFCVYDDGTGPALYAGGGFYDWFGGGPIGYVLRWREGSWQQAGAGITGPIYSLCVYDDGSGPALCAAGGYCSIQGGTSEGPPPDDGVSIGYAARLRDGTWESIGDALESPVSSLCVYDDGAGPALYAGTGCQGECGADMRTYVAKWEDGAWKTVGADMLSSVYSLCVYDDGTGPALLAGGAFYPYGSFVGAKCIARWRNGSWQDMGSGFDGAVCTMCARGEGYGSTLYVGGMFSTVGTYESRGVARWGCEPTHAAVCPGSAKFLPDASLVTLTEQAASAVFGNTFYVESPDRSSGLRVDLPGHAIARNRRVSVTGRMRTSNNGERFLEGFAACDRGPLSVQPLWVTVDALGGGDLGSQSGVWGWIRQIDPSGAVSCVWGRESGLNNIGLLVRCSGTLTPRDASSFYVSDGIERVLVTVPAGVFVDPAWQHVSLTGISSCALGASGLERAIRVRGQGDITSN